MVAHTENPSYGKGRDRRILGVLWPVNLTGSVSPKFSERLNSPQPPKIRQRVAKEEA